MTCAIVRCSWRPSPPAAARRSEVAVLRVEDLTDEDAVRPNSVDEKRPSLAVHTLRAQQDDEHVLLIGRPLTPLKRWLMEGGDQQRRRCLGSSTRGQQRPADTTAAAGQLDFRKPCRANDGTRPPCTRRSHAASPESRSSDRPLRALPTTLRLASDKHRSTSRDRANPSFNSKRRESRY